MNSKKYFIDIFSGAGGLSCGMEMIPGMECVLGIDFDQHAINTFAKNHKHAETYCGDIRQLKNTDVLKKTQDKKIFAVVGGPPCQGFSTVGLGNPDDDRNSLFLEFVRIVKLTKPSFIVVENVTGLLAKKNEKTLRAIFAQFEKLGYHLDVRVLSAHNYGVAEKRRRTIILGSNLNCDIAFPKITHDAILAKTHRAAVTVGQVFSNLKTKNKTILNHDIEKAEIKKELDLARIKCIPEGKGIRYQKDEEAYLPKKLRLGVNWDELRENRFRQTKYQRLDSKLPSPTIMTHRHNYFHPTEPRYLTQREAAAIQSFPNDFEFTGPLAAQWRQIGNAVPPLLGKAIGNALVQMQEASDQNTKASKLPKRDVFKERSKAFSY